MYKDTRLSYHDVEEIYWPKPPPWDEATWLDWQDRLDQEGKEECHREEIGGKR